ncbi:heme/hemin ABC transporter substrate-binding protein [Actibacterium lipolyticum]|uniref:Hemin-binding periplasmic protein HmuT n=1 Tax=Actibacterium lipolyticum TaxID=1524263 RepID=A0A238KK78_9RHOB|nr:ABC transporter substrate-binding protein [Actibacterium lipolyticum]SMX42466.1 Hemin-binding periplasmic protein HmuT precursor [Actibacterium lipolyticum]
MIRATHLSAILFLGALTAGVTGSQAQDPKVDTSRVLSIGGSITEIVYALGQEDRLVARDTTSSFPAAAVRLPDVGYMRALSPEGVLSVNPGMIIAEEGAGPPETIAVLQDADISFTTVPEAYSRQGVYDKILAVGQALGVSDAAQQLAGQVDAQILQAEGAAGAIPDADKKRVLFILSTQGGRILASGENTAADAIIRMAGGVNSVSGFEGYKPLTDEAISVAAPEVILMMARGVNHEAMTEELFAMPAIATTPAAENRALVRMNGLYMLGFGPRTADAIADLNTALYGG